MHTKILVCYNNRERNIGNEKNTLKRKLHYEKQVSNSIILCNNHGIWYGIDIL